MTDKPVAAIKLDDKGAALIAYEDDGGAIAFEIVVGDDSDIESTTAMKVIIGLGYIAATDPKLVTEAYFAAIDEDMVHEQDTCEVEGHPKWADNIEGEA